MNSKIYKYFIFSTIVLVSGLIYFSMIYSNRIVISKLTNEDREKQVQSEQETKAKTEAKNATTYETQTEGKAVTKALKTEVQTETKAVGKTEAQTETKTETKVEVQTETERQEKSGKQKINLNIATKQELMTLKGIGEKKAEQIIRHREEKGKFKRIEDIMLIKGIKRKAFQKIKDDITVSPTGEE